MTAPHIEIGGSKGVYPRQRGSWASEGGMAR